MTVSVLQTTPMLKTTQSATLLRKPAKRNYNIKKNRRYIIQRETELKEESN